MISTRPSDSATVVDIGNINSKNERIKKPQVVLDYNEGRIGTDLSDQLSSYDTYLKRSIKWYRKVAFELVFGAALVNSYLIYKENYAASKVTILRFRERLVRSLLFGMSFEKLKPSVREKPIGQAKRKLADHKLVEKRRIWMRCSKALCWLLWKIRQ